MQHKPQQYSALNSKWLPVRMGSFCSSTNKHNLPPPVVQELFHTAHEYANLSNRAGTVASDLVLACDDLKLPPKAFYSIKKRVLKRKQGMPRSFLHPRVSRHNSVAVEPMVNIQSPALLPPPSRSPSPDLLGSDDEGGPPAIPTTLRGISNYFPALPPKHTYLRTPVGFLPFQFHDSWLNCQCRHRHQSEPHSLHSRRNSKLPHWFKSHWATFFRVRRTAQTRKTTNFWVILSIGRWVCIPGRGGKLVHDYIRLSHTF